MENLATRTLDPVHDILHYARQPLDAIFAPQAVAVIGATEKRRQRRPHDPVEPDQQPVRRHGLSGQSQAAAACLGIKAYPNVADIPEPVGPGRDRDPGRQRPRRHRRVRRGWRQRRPSSSRRASRRSAPRACELERQILEKARAGGMRIIGPNCLGVMNPVDGLNATFATGMRPAGQRRLHQPERRPVHGHSGLEPAGERRLQRVRLHRLDARRRLGRPDRLPRRRPQHQAAS